MLWPYKFSKMYFKYVRTAHTKQNKKNNDP